MPRIKKPKYLFYKNALPERIPKIGEEVSIFLASGDLFIEGTVDTLDYDYENWAGDFKGFSLRDSANGGWWWHMGTFHEGGSNNDKILRVKESL